MKIPTHVQTATVRKAARTADLVFGACGLVALAFEICNIVDGVPGNTISERTRHYFRVKGKVGSLVFLATLGSATTWFAAHIVERKV